MFILKEGDVYMVMRYIFQMKRRFCLICLRSCVLGKVGERAG